MHQNSGGEKGDEPRARGVSGNLVMFADATPPLSKRGGLPGLQSPPGGGIRASAWARRAQRASCTRSATQKHGSRKTHSQTDHSPRPGPSPGAGSSELCCLPPSIVTKCKGAKLTPQSLECELGVSNPPLKRRVPSTTGQNQLWAPAGIARSVLDSAVSLLLFANNELAAKHVPPNT